MYIGESKRNAEVDEMKIIIQLKVQNHQNSFETLSTTVLHKLLFKCSKNWQDQEGLRDIILRYGNLILTNKRILKD